MTKNNISSEQPSSPVKNQSDITRKIGAGIIGSAFETVIRQPITAVQTYSITHKCSALEATKHIFKVGGLLGFYNGLQGFTIGYCARALHRTGVFLMNDALTKYNVPTLGIAALATIYEVAVTGVSDTMLTLTQSQNKKTSVSSPIATFHNHIKQHGLTQVLGAGLGGSLCRNLSFCVGYLAPGNAWPEYKQQNPVVMGIGSGVLAVCVSHPFEVMRVKQVLQPTKSVVNHILESGKKGIVKEFSRGIAPRLASAGIGSAISYAAYAKLTSSSSSVSR